MYRVGLGSDIHKFDSGRKLILGGIEIEHSKGLLGHSDADVVLHALGDALLGAAALGDLGEHFPPDEKNKDRSSTKILRDVCHLVWNHGFHVVNVDIIVMAEEPKLAKYRTQMRTKIAQMLNVEIPSIGVKATTCEGLGSIGRKEGIYAQAVVLLKRREEQTT